jgi:hypothetical protein
VGAPLFLGPTHEILQSAIYNLKSKINSALENIGLNIQTVFYTRHA